MSVLPRVTAAMTAEWPDLIAELDRWGEAGKIASLWWRDDDAVAATPALRSLLRLTGDLPLALAVIPAELDPDLPGFLRPMAQVAVLQHGWRHANHAAPGAKKTKTVFFKAERFVEKPNYETALDYLNSGQYRWNAGMFVWSFITVTNGLEKHQPEMFAACQRWFKVANNPAKLSKVLAKEYPEIKKISIDYALMEKAQNVIVADGAFDWDDLGAWNALARHLKADAEGNCAVADFIHVDAARNLIYDARTKNRTPIAVVGLRDSILVQTDDAVLLAHKSQAQKIKELVKKLGEDARLKKLV